MMLYPSIVDLLEKAGSKYSLVIAASKRAREICENGDENGDSLDGARGITKAAEEIADGTISIINYEGKDEIIEKLKHVSSEEYAENVMHIQMSDLDAIEKESLKLKDEEADEEDDEDSLYDDDDENEEDDD